MIEVKGKGGISAKIIADSDYNNKRIVTYELVYPRFIHSEFMTHRMLSKNAASSRAIPVEKQIENILANTAMPIHWGKNQPGMSAKEECTTNIGNTQYFYPDGSKVIGISREDAWNVARDKAIEMAREFHAAGYHKQIVNRLLEPFTFMKTVCTATEYANLFHLRCHPDAQPEFQELARCMKEAYDTHKPMELKADDWHVPYYGDGYIYRCSFVNGLDFESELKDALMISASCCAQVSYRKNDDSIEKARDIYKRLVESKPMHASPFEHQATPINSLTQKGITHYTSNEETQKLGLWSGNFKGWVQHRQLIVDNVVW